MVIIHYFELNPAISNNPAIFNQAYFLFGRARFIFYLLAGVGLFYLSKEALTNQNPIALQYTKNRIRTRGIVIGLMGVVLFFILNIAYNFWVEILIVYGIFFFLFSFVFTKRKNILLILLILLLIAFVLATQQFIIQYKAYSGETIYLDSYIFLLSILDALLEAFTTIFIGFLVATLLVNKKYSKYFILVGLILIIIPLLLDIFFYRFLNSINLYILPNYSSSLQEKPILDYISRMGSSFILIPVINIIASANKENILTKAVALSGRHSLTLYVIQIISISIITRYITIDTIFLALVYGLLTILVLILYSNLNYLSKYTRLLELVVRHFSDSYKNIRLYNNLPHPVPNYFNPSVLNEYDKVCKKCGSQLNLFEPNYVFSITRANFGFDIHKEALKGFIRANYWGHIQYIKYLFENYPNVDRISFSEIYCPNDLFTVLRIMNS